MGAIKIVSGRWRGRALETPAGRDTRPLLTRLRKSLTDILRPKLAGSAVLDLFGGSGAISFELLSNGAQSAVVIEADRIAASIISANARIFEAQAEAIHGDCFNVMIELERAGRTFDIIIVAPPYGNELHERALDLLATSSLAATGATVVAQRDKGEKLWEGDGRLGLVETRAYGRTVFDFYETK